MESEVYKEENEKVISDFEALERRGVLTFYVVQIRICSSSSVYLSIQYVMLYIAERQQQDEIRVLESDIAKLKVDTH